MTEQLPPGWASVTTSSGERYFYHEDTRETSWEFPSSARDRDARSADRARSSGASASGRGVEPAARPGAGARATPSEARTERDLKLMLADLSTKKHVVRAARRCAPRRSAPLIPDDAPSRARTAPPLRASFEK